MADNVDITPGTGATVAADLVGGALHQRVKISQGIDGSATDVSSTDPLNVTLANTGANATAVKVNVASGGIASGAIASGAVASGAFAAGAISDGADVTVGAKTDAKSTATDGTSTSLISIEKQISASVQAINTALGSTALDLGSGTGGTRTLRTIIDSSQFASLGQATMANSQPVTIASNQTWPVGTTGFAKAEDVASADGDVGIPAMVVRKATPANSSGTDGDYEFLQASGGYLWVHDNKGLANKLISAAFTTLTRPANTTAYAAADSISDNATAGSVTALTGTFSDVNDDPIFISEILISSTDTGLAGKRIRAYLFNSDPTASSGVGGGDNAAYSQKKAGYVGSFSGVLETGFSDGTVGRLVPSFNDSTTAPGQNAPAGGFIVTKPTSGAQTLFIQYQAIDAFTPSANSTTIIGTARGWQGRAA